MTTSSGGPSVHTSLTLLGRLCEQEADSWERFCRIYTPFVWRWAGQMGLPVSDREDVVQEVFNRVHRSLAKFDRTQNGSFRSWLKTISRNLVRDQFRHKAGEPDAIGGTDAMRLWHELPDDTPDVEQLEDTEVERLAMRHLDLGLNPQHQQAVERLVAGGSPKDVADELNLTHANVLQIWSRAKRNARQLLEGLQSQVS